MKIGRQLSYSVFMVEGRRCNFGEASLVRVA